jgi:hypothetical protein
MLSIKREPAYADMLRNYVVVLDGRPIGKIGDGETQNFDIKPGTHTLFMRISWTRSPKVRFYMKNGQQVAFHCSSNLKGSRILLIIFYVTILRTRYIKLVRTD